MRMAKERLDEVLEEHSKWLRTRFSGKVEGSRADLSCVDLSNINLSGANLSWADLSGANLSWADLSGANLSFADLFCADLSGADLFCADLSDANLCGAENVPFIPMACPDTGEFIGWKKAIHNDESVIVKLMIPSDAKRLSATGRKCRCDKAKVLTVESVDGSKTYSNAISHRDRSFAYVVGQTIVPENDFCEDRWEECSSGIHFFINRQEAVNYNM